MIFLEKKLTDSLKIIDRKELQEQIRKVKKNLIKYLTLYRCKYILENLDYGQGVYIYDNKLSKCLFNKQVGEYYPRVNELEKTRDLRTTTGKWK